MSGQMEQADSSNDDSESTGTDIPPLANLEVGAEPDVAGLGQVEWEHDMLSESNYNRGYKEALEKAFPNGDYPQYVNYPPREVKGNVIKTPEFDDKLKGLKDNTEVVDQLNDKIKQIKNE